MGQLIIPEDQQTRGRMMEVAMLMRKVELRLSMEQLAALGRIMSSYLANLDLLHIDDKAVFFLLYQIYEGKVRKKMLSTKRMLRLSLDMAQAWAMISMLQDMDMAPWPFEESVKQWIIYEIDHKTV